MNPLPAYELEAFFDAATASLSYLVLDPVTRQAAVIDPADATSGRQAAWLRAHGAALQWVLHTRERAGRPPLAEGLAFAIGRLPARAWRVPGHTQDGTAYLVGELAWDGTGLDVFVGDTLWMPDIGTARCDGPGADPRRLYRSINRLLSLPPATRLHPGHDFPPPGREPCWACTVAEQREASVHVRDGISEDAFVVLRRARDAALAGAQATEGRGVRVADFTASRQAWSSGSV